MWVDGFHWVLFGSVWKERDTRGDSKEVPDTASTKAGEHGSEKSIQRKLFGQSAA